MKWIISTTVFILGIVLLFACQGKKEGITEVVILSDITERHLARPDTTEILPMFNLSNKWQGAGFRLIDLTDVSYNQATEAKLETRSEWLSNEFDREKELQDFTTKVTDIVNKANHHSIGRQNSSIYEPMAHELNALSQNPEQRKVLIIYSDLMENTATLSLYRQKDLNLLKSDPQSIRNYLETMVPLRSLQGMEIYIIFQPTDTLSDQTFRIVSEFYRQWFESLGAKVNVSANLNTGNNENIL